MGRGAVQGMAVRKAGLGRGAGQLKAIGEGLRREGENRQGRSSQSKVRLAEISR